jgi:hypothetical protein
MAIEIHLPRKYSRATLEMLRNNDGPNVVMTPGAVETTIEEFTDKAGQPVTKQSVLDIFNKQVIERTNHIPKYSRDYYFVPMGNFGGWHDNGMHAGLVNMLGNAYLSNEYGFMCMHDYLKLSDFKDREGDITIDDLSNTFSETINKLGTLSKLKITIKKGNRVFSESTHYAIGNGSTPSNLIDYNEVKNRIINSDDFNGVCKKWFARIVDNSRNNPINYEVRLPDPVVTSAFSFKLEGYHYIRDNFRKYDRDGTNKVTIDGLNGGSDIAIYFELPMVTRNLTGLTFEIRQHSHVFSFNILINIFNKKTMTLIGGLDRRNYGNGRHTVRFNNIFLSNNASDDIVIKFSIQCDGGLLNGTNLNFDILELLFNDDFAIDPNADLPEPSIDVINSQLNKVRNDGVDHRGTMIWAYRLKDHNRRLHTVNIINIPLINPGISLPGHQIRLEVHRNGSKIGEMSNSKLLEMGYNKTVRMNISNTDMKNGDDLVFIADYWFPDGWNRDIRTKSLENFKPKIEFIYYYRTLISR